MEVPEIYNGAVDMVAIAREAGSRSKVAVRARQDGVDPVGSCVGLRGVRIQNIVNELQGEKIDILEWNRDIARFIANALNPAQVMRVELDPVTNTAIAVVPDRQLSLAIGKEGQNARLAAKLTGWSVDIMNSTDAEAAALERARIAAEIAALEAAEKARREAEEREREAEQEAMAAEATSLRNLPEDIWTIPTVPGQAEPSGIRFAEDIDGLRGGVTARRTRRNASEQSTQTPTTAARGGRRRGRGRPGRRRR